MSDIVDDSVPSLVETTLEEHRGCMEIVAEVEACLDCKPDDGEGWIGALIGRLDSLRITMREHFASEESGPLFRSLPASHPRLADRLQALEGEHAAMLGDIEAVLVAADRVDPSEIYELRELNARVQLLVARIRRHEAAENELVMEAHWDEVGVGD